MLPGVLQLFSLGVGHARAKEDAVVPFRGQNSDFGVVDNRHGCLVCHVENCSLADLRDSSKAKQIMVAN